MHHHYKTFHQSNFIVNDVNGGSYCGFLLTSKETNCFLNNLNGSQEEENEHIVGYSCRWSKKRCCRKID